MNIKLGKKCGITEQNVGARQNDLVSMITLSIKLSVYISSCFISILYVSMRFLIPKMYRNKNAWFYVIIKIYKYSNDILIFAIGRFDRDRVPISRFYHLYVEVVCERQNIDSLR